MSPATFSMWMFSILAPLAAGLGNVAEASALIAAATMAWLWRIEEIMRRSDQERFVAEIRRLRLEGDEWKQ